MIRLIKISSKLFAIEDNHARASNQVPVGSLSEASAYLADFHGVPATEITMALAAMESYDANAADFGVLRGAFMYASQLDLTGLRIRIGSLHSTSAVAVCQ